MAGQEGFEPPSPGFGVRCSNRWSYWPNLSKKVWSIGLLETKELDALFLALLLCFLVESMSLTESAVFLKLQFLRCISLVFGCRIIPSLALSAGKGNDISHIGSFSILKCDDFVKSPSAALCFIFSHSTHL